MVKQKIAIIGYGRFGRLLVKLLCPYGQVFVIHPRKIINRSIKQIKYQDLKNIDWVIPAVPISVLPAVLKKMSPYLKDGSLVMDVCSVKVRPCQWLKQYLPKDVELLGTHPMFGPDSAKHGLKNLQIIFCPVRISLSRLRQISDIFKKIQLNVITTTPKNHDQQAAKSLALVHFIGRALSEIKIKKQRISSLGFERLLSVDETVTNDTWQLFYDMHKYNPYAKKMRASYMGALHNIDKMVK